MKKSKLFLMLFAFVAFGPTAWAWSSSGTSNDPYLITSETDWNTLATNVNGGTSYSGKYFKLTADITIASTIGAEDCPFSGTFDGGGHILNLNITDQANQGTAPFRYISGATIRLVKTTGTVNGTMHCSGLVGFAKDNSTNYIRNCEVAVIVNCGGSSHTYCGGVLGHGKTSTTTIVNCLFSGSISGATNLVGIIYGWGDGGTHTIENCLSTGTCNGADNIRLIAKRSNYYIINCYHTTNLSEEQGTNANGMINEALMAALGNDWQISGGKVVPLMQIKTLTGSGTAESPYLIASTTDWNNLATNVNTFGETYNGRYFKMTENLSSVSSTVGTDSAPFSGIFDGNGHSLNLNITDQINQGTAPFRYISGATIRFVKTTGTVNGTNHCAGLVGFAKDNSTNYIRNCEVAVTVNCGGNSHTHCGGVLGHGKTSTTTIVNCLFSGSISGATKIVGIIYGWYDTSGGTHTIKNCLSTGTCNGESNKYLIAVRNNTIIITNCYRTTSNVSQGNDANGMTNEALVAALGSAWQISGGRVVPATTQLVAVYREIVGYGNSTESDHWAFIASPVSTEGGIAPTAVDNLVGTYDSNTGLYDYDLYRFNPLANLEWENYNNTTHHDGFKLINGIGYLYASKEDKTLTFTGTFNTGTSKEITGLPAGFNLVGNPFTVDAYVNKPYYTLNGDGSAISTTTSNAAIPPCYGVIVELDGTEDVIVTTTQQNANNGGNLNIVLSQVVEPSDPSLRGGTTKQPEGSSTEGRKSTLDNAIVTFNEGSELGKFYFGEQNANIYLPQGGKDYAIAYSEGVGEMPLNFKANENGEYSLTITPDGADFAYLHLIDNLTGADIDLLSMGDRGSAPAMTTEGVSYTFTAKTTDYASRFRLVFVTNDENGASTGSGTFVFIDASGNIIITGVADACDASLQVIDAMGRVIRTVGLSQCGSRTTTAGMVPGVYVLRLIDGNDVKTQKIVVR